MKAISLRQPWATLMAIGAKVVETRSWRTEYRGDLLIQAAQSRKYEDLRYCAVEPFLSVLAAAGISNVDDLPFGKIVCGVRLWDCRPTASVRGLLSAQELAFGNYDDDRYALLTDNLRRIKPYPQNGSLGLFDVDLPAGVLT